MAAAKVTREPGEDRLLAPAKNAKPQSADVHTRWVRDSDKRIRQMEQQGFVKADESDVQANHDGWKTPEGVLRNGDLILMKADRARVEEKRTEINRFNADRERARVEQANKEFDSKTGHGQERKGKFYSIP